MVGPAVLVSPPDALPVAVEDLRRFCRVKDGSEDDFLLSLARSATARLQGYGGKLGRALIHSTWRQSFGGFPFVDSCRMRLKLPDVASAKLVFLDALDVEGAPIETGFAVRRDEIGWFVDPKRGTTWPSARGFVEYVAGYGATPEAVPAPIREAICMLVQGSYRLTAADATLRNETTDGVGSQGYFGPEIMRNAVTAHVDDLLKPYRWIPV